MDLTNVIDNKKVCRGKAREAISLALDGLWEKAVEANLFILGIYPDDVEALNRLGKSLLETGDYERSRDAFSKAVQVDPYNTIARKNINRILLLKKDRLPLKKLKSAVDYNFIAESGKSIIVALNNLAPNKIVANMTAGDAINLRPNDSVLVAENLYGDYIGTVEHRLGLRIIRLINGGNRYEAAVASVRHAEITTIIRETYRHPDQSIICSFPVSHMKDNTPNIEDSIFNNSTENEIDEDSEELESVDKIVEYRIGSRDVQDLYNEDD